jgi:hypothetical protein
LNIQMLTPGRDSGAIDKEDLKRFIAWAEKNFNLPCLHDFLTAIPTAELEPITGDYVQSDEADMGMTYQQLTGKQLPEINSHSCWPVWGVIRYPFG